MTTSPMVRALSSCERRRVVRSYCKSLALESLLGSAGTIGGMIDHNKGALLDSGKPAVVVGIDIFKTALGKCSSSFQECRMRLRRHHTVK